MIKYNKKNIILHKLWKSSWLGEKNNLQIFKKQTIVSNPAVTRRLLFVAPQGGAIFSMSGSTTLIPA